MAKDPAFLFYPGDWLGGTLGMTFEEKGAYMELLMLQFNRGHMTEHMIGQTVGQLWVTLKDKFIQDASGLWYNERLELEKEKRKNYVDSRKNNPLGNNKHKKEAKKTRGRKTNHMTSHMEDEDVNENKDINKDDLILPFQSDEFKKKWGLLLKEKKWKNRSVTALEEALKKLSKFTEEEATQAISDAISGEYQGIFPKSTKNGTTKHKRPLSATEREASATATSFDNDRERAVKFT